MPQAQKLTNLLVDDKYGSADAIMALPSAKALAIVEDPAGSVYAKSKACMRLAVVGGKNAVPAIARLLDHPQLSVYARFALEPLPDPAVDDALRAALGKLQGNLLIGLINSIGKRRDTKALPALEKLRRGDDVAIASAAGAAMGRIRPLL